MIVASVFRVTGSNGCVACMLIVKRVHRTGGAVRRKLEVHVAVVPDI